MSTAVAAKAAPTTVLTRLTIRFGDGLTGPQLLEAGNYDEVGDVARKFVNSAKFRIAEVSGEADLEFLKFDHGPMSDEVLAEIARRGLEEPMEEDALRIGMEYPADHYERPIVFLHSKNLWRNIRVLVRGDWGPARGLDCRWFDCSWDSRCQFAARRPRK